MEILIQRSHPEDSELIYSLLYLVLDHSGANLPLSFAGLVPPVNGRDIRNLEYPGSTVPEGAVFLDYDQDGYLDIYVTNGTYAEGLSEGTACWLGLFFYRL